MLPLKGKHSHAVLSPANVWPSDSLPKLEPAFKALGCTICSVATLLLQHCDSLIQQQLDLPGSSSLSTPDILAVEADQHSQQARTASSSNANQNQLANLMVPLQHQLSNKGRLLHYYSVAPADNGMWCGWHEDFGTLTGAPAAQWPASQTWHTDKPDPFRHQLSREYPDTPRPTASRSFCALLLHHLRKCGAPSCPALLPLPQKADTNCCRDRLSSVKASGLTHARAYIGGSHESPRTSAVARGRPACVLGSTALQRIPPQVQSAALVWTILLSITIFSALSARTP